MEGTCGEPNPAGERALPVPIRFEKNKRNFDII
jgi:hypothetical protein